MNNSEEKLGKAPLGKLMLSMGIPTLVAQLINLLYNLVDRIYIGQGVGREALTGVGLTLPAIMIITAFSSFAGAGGAPLAAIALGQGKKERAERILGNAFAMLCCFSLVLMILFFCIGKPFLYLVGASDLTYPFASVYLRIYLIGTFFVQLVVGLNPFITAQGQSKVAMGSVMIGAGCNIILDPIFIFGFKMGVSGAALATILSQCLGAVWVLRFILAPSTSLRLHIKYIKPDWSLIRGIMALGVSPFIMQSTESLISVVMSSGLQRYGGDVYVGSLTILQSILLLINTPIQGFTQGVQPILSYNFGAGNIERVRLAYRRIISATALASFLLTLLAMMFPRFLARLFTQDQELIALVEQVTPIFFAGMLIFGVQLGCQTTFMGLGQAKISLFMALLRKVFLLVPLAILLPLVTGNVISIYLSEAIADTLGAVICATVFLIQIPKILSRKNGLV